MSPKQNKSEQPRGSGEGLQLHELPALIFPAPGIPTIQSKVDGCPAAKCYDHVTYSCLLKSHS